MAIVRTFAYKTKKIDTKHLFLCYPQAKAVFYIILNTGYITEE